MSEKGQKSYQKEYIARCLRRNIFENLMRVLKKSRNGPMRIKIIKERNKGVNEVYVKKI